jgi:hypothetical protein
MKYQKKAFLLTAGRLKEAENNLNKCKQQPVDRYE